jgi:hypothetical protein
MLNNIKVCSNGLEVTSSKSLDFVVIYLAAAMDLKRHLIRAWILLLSIWPINF